ncbi:Chromosome partition protein smc [Streptococcus acidominimus]|uniref:Chromosome partition protein Smc n=1 Tax=Streptococcus acidominimus TaxID=1326 RepID=A0A239XBV1_STRAI|nr:chromosome segregation protein SMC [Streptococcus acidominimus]SNV43810.1 Chromosome partition protein smc [Streptococcus acidominimus]
MFLKEIEIQGFKSFADKTKITFDKGVTAVVGPNGSGKSNITESLRWALGESSAKSLRGGKMPDVIFAGTETRRPLNYAQVRVTLDNSDGFIKNAPEQLSVERHIYRNGDSDYLIEGKKVRLRDIHDLFMDTGLGRDSFSIISQGRVEAIFNSKPDERRAIFEEAAGVLKYKTRKKETETKLNQTQDNLDRLEDIIYELEQQIRPLAKQAETAKQFLQLDGERKDLQLRVLVHDITAGKADLEDLEAQLEQTQEELEAYYQQRQALEEHNQDLKTCRHQFLQKAQRCQDDIVSLTSLIADLEKKIQVGILQESQSQEKKADLQERIEQNDNRLENLRTEHEHLVSQLDQVHQAMTIKQAAIKDLEKQLSQFAQSPDHIMEQLREQFVGLMSEEADLTNQLTTIENRLTQAEREVEQAQEELRELTSKKAAMLASAKEALEAFEEAKAGVKHLLDDYQKAYRKLQLSEKAFQNKQTQLFDQYDHLKSLKARQASLEAIQKNHSQFYAGVKAVLQNRDQLGGGVIGAVSEHLSFALEHQTAVEIALGASAQHVIVADEATAKSAIHLLKSKRLGRATFLPLTTIKPRALKSHLLQSLKTQEGFLGVASELVRFEPDLSRIMENLLGLTVIFDTIDHANRAARLVNYQVRLVTLDGTELRPGGSYSGGTNRQKNTTFVNVELEQLQKAIASDEQLIKEQETALALLKADFDQAREQCDNLKQEGEDARLLEQRTELAYQQASEQLAEISRLYDVKVANEGHQELTDVTTTKENLSQRLLEIGQQKGEITRSIEAIKNDKDSIEDKRQELTQALSDAKLSERELEGREHFLKRDQDKLSQEMDRVKQDQEQLRMALSTHGESVDVSQIPEWQEQLEASQTRKMQSEEEHIRLRFEIEDLEAQTEEAADQLHVLGTQNEEYIRRQAQLETRAKQLKQSLQQLGQELAESYQLSFRQAMTACERLEEDQVGPTKQALKDLLKAIKALGPVNLEAIEQHKEVAQRLDFLSGQKMDLDKAKTLLLETITDMNQEVTSRFQTTFEAIRVSFKETFTQMFGGGSADLILTTGDLLFAGVDISVQPPGKKIQSLNLMSGGEKALSALALLFAIIRVKTIPFVILDEVEAALDEANVKRFGDYLNRFDKSSQFIVVTHRKGTMAAADSIYGVTMQESGVSQVLSVRLKDAENFKGVT